MISEATLRRLADELAAVPGVCAVVLGGSRARGTHHPDSDVDLGLYVTADVDRPALSGVAKRWHGSTVEIGDAGSWGPWVDSGAWITIADTAVDLILRDVARVAEQCARATRGEFAFHHQPGHPLGFLDIAYAGEVALSIPLVDDEAVHARLAASITPYPEALSRALVNNLWQVDFHLDGAAKAAGAGDTAYVCLCITNAVMLLAHSWHAVCGAWAINEKGLLPGVSRLRDAPASFSSDAAAILAETGSTPEELYAAIARTRALPRPE
ncbi:nucleotidyltransferase domain-containing protein [Tessaracoccus caeni]|uniref:nucleotidyltransferase domain-containing protein n=1 Tax=Tessaracoccus caeni TaxID=3031239 RepID=UPI0023D9AE70|nr:nucleotidyltransferase domain-containing protein [Tessaracoccus caeni]MDF1487015.1 nucleotidyltransferase domain-containing protein [Tessaracoccus caeni]